MSNKNYRTLNGLYKALVKQETNCIDDYTFLKNDEDITIFNSEGRHGAISGTLIENLMPILKRSCWMLRYSEFHERLELIVWLVDGTI